MPHLPPMSPIEYEIFFALLQLKQKGVKKATLKQICKEVNSRRKRHGEHTLSTQHVYYYLKKLIKRPFVKRDKKSRVTLYFLKTGTWKLKQNPPLCIHINDADLVLICDRVYTCRKRPSIKCIKNLVNQGKITLPTGSKVLAKSNF